MTYADNGISDQEEGVNESSSAAAKQQSPARTQTMTTAIGDVLARRQHKMATWKSSHVTNVALSLASTSVTSYLSEPLPELAAVALDVSHNSFWLPSSHYGMKYFCFVRDTSNTHNYCNIT
jgi:hypothetical protein